MSLRVLIDASCLKRQQGGIRSYTLGLTSALGRVEGFGVVLATPFPDDVRDGRIAKHPVPASVASPMQRAFWRETRLPGLVRRYESDIVIVPIHEQPIRRLPVPTVMVMHDLGPLVAPALYGRTRWTRYLLTLPHAVKAASAIVSMSHATQADLYGNFNVDLAKCRVIETGTQELPAVNGAPRPIKEDYALYVGTLMRHKNIRTLVRAYAVDDGRLPAKLVLAGPHQDEERQAVDTWAREASVPTNRIVQLGYVPAQVLAALYQHASVCVLPSLHEGFGAPIIEAMRSNTPFVASDIPAHREVAQDAARYVSETLSPAAWRDAIGDVYMDSAIRERMRAKGAGRARYYTWERVGAEWADLLLSLAAEN